MTAIRSQPPVLLETQDRAIKFAFRMTPSLAKRVRERVAGRPRGARSMLFRRGIDRAIAAVRARRPIGRMAGQLEAAAESMTEMATLNLTEAEYQMIESATAGGTREEMTVLIRAGIELVLEEPAVPVSRRA